MSLRSSTTTKSPSPLPSPIGTPPGTPPEGFEPQGGGSEPQGGMGEGVFRSDGRAFSFFGFLPSPAFAARRPEAPSRRTGEGRVRASFGIVSCDAKADKPGHSA